MFSQRLHEWKSDEYQQILCRLKMLGVPKPKLFCRWNNYGRPSYFLWPCPFCFQLSVIWAEHHASPRASALMGFDFFYTLSLPVCLPLWFPSNYGHSPVRPSAPGPACLSANMSYTLHKTSDTRYTKPPKHQRWAHRGKNKVVFCSSQSWPII